jgi:hypothetical protein
MKYPEFLNIFVEYSKVEQFCQVLTARRSPSLYLEPTRCGFRDRLGMAVSRPVLFHDLHLPFGNGYVCNEVPDKRDLSNRASGE